MSGGDISSNKVNVANSFSNGDLVTYHAPNVQAEFSSGQVNVQLTYSGSDVNGHTGAAHVIYFALDTNGNGKLDNGDDVGLNTGDRIYYSASNPGDAIGGLSSGSFYWVIRIDGLDYELADSKCHATGSVADCGSAQSPVALTLTPDTSDSGKAVVHTFAVASAAPIGGLTDGNDYYVVNASGSSFQLSTTSGGSAISIFNQGGGGKFSIEGIDLTGNGSGAQELVIPITDGSGTQQLVGIGGPAFAAAAGDGIVSASATGGGGGVISVSDANSFASVDPTVETTIGGNASLTAGNNISVTTHGFAFTKAVSSNDSGGLISVNSANSNAAAHVANTLDIDSGATLDALGTIFGGGNVTVSANSHLQPVTIASSGSGGLFAGGSGGTFAAADYTTKTNMNGTIIASNNASVEAHTSIDGATATITADVGGLGVDASTNALICIGSNSGECHNAESAHNDGVNEVDIQGSGSVTGNQISINALIDHLDATLSTRTHATALGAGSEADGTIDVSGQSQVRLESSSSLTGNVLTSLDAEYQDINLHSTADASCSCLGGETDSTSTINDTADARVSGLAGSHIETSGLNVIANQDVTFFHTDCPNSGGFLDFGNGGDCNSSPGMTRSIYWESSVVLLASPNPELTVDSSGRITRLVNVTVHDCNGGSCSGPLSLGQTIASGDTIAVDDILNNQSAQVLFEANNLGSVDGQGTPAGNIWGASGLFQLQHTWDFVKLLNSSDRALLVHAIDVVNLGAGAVVTVDVQHIPGPTGETSQTETAPGTTFEFDIQHTFPPTLVQIEGLQPGAVSTSTITLDGTITNPIGTTQIENERGSILNGPDNPGHYVLTNILEIDADAAGADPGSVGSLSGTRNPIAVILEQSAYTDGSGTHTRNFQITGDAAGDLVLDLTALRRDNSSGAFPVTIQLLHAGHNVDLVINDSLGGNDVPPFGTFIVNLYTPNSNGTKTGPLSPCGAPCGSGSGSYLEHFRPDGAAPDLTTILRAFGTTNATVAHSDYTFSDVSAGNDIEINHNSTATVITFTAFSNVDATLHDLDNAALESTSDNSGKIDMKTNGFIVDTETTGDLRVGRIWSTGDDVTLNSPAAVLDAELDNGTLGTDPTTTDVIGRNITITAGNNGIGGTSGRGGVGTPNDFLEIQVNADGGALGVLTVTDTAASRTAWSITPIPGNLPPAQRHLRRLHDRRRAATSSSTVS